MASGLVHAAARRVASFRASSAASARFTARSNAASANAASAAAAFCCPPATPAVAGRTEAARFELEHPSRGVGTGRGGVGCVDRGGSGGGSGRPSRATSALGMASGLVHAAESPAARAAAGRAVAARVGSVQPPSGVGAGFGSIDRVGRVGCVGVGGGGCVVVGGGGVVVVGVGGGGGGGGGGRDGGGGRVGDGRVGDGEYPVRRSNFVAAVAMLAAALL